jgi:hypothetical protein
MQHALVNGEKTEAQPSLRGVCRICGGVTIAKCGQHMVWHWAHKSRAVCDRWWESETEWHRHWKDQFPKEWQEIICHDITGEKHIADIKTPHGTAVEFQHSPLDPEEMRSREAFYGDMIWVVNGTRSELDPGFFRMGIHPKPTAPSPPAHQLDWHGRGKILLNWSQAEKPVYLDFGQFQEGVDLVWRLIMYDGNTKVGFVGPMHKKHFIETILEGGSFPRVLD